MQRPSHLLGLFMISCLLAGCGGGSESTATPDHLEDASKAANKMRLRDAANPNTKAATGASKSTRKH